MTTLAERLEEIEQAQIEQRWRRLGVDEPPHAVQDDASHELGARVAARAQVAVELSRQLLLTGRLEDADDVAHEGLVQVAESRALLGDLGAAHEWQIELSLAELAELRVMVAGAGI
jgi:uncharacterized coiled-coil protein SlyX